jgi:hypothetical protein
VVKHVSAPAKVAIEQKEGPTMNRLAQHHRTVVGRTRVILGSLLAAGLLASAGWTAQPAAASSAGDVSGNSSRATQLASPASADQAGALRADSTEDALFHGRWHVKRVLKLKHGTKHRYKVLPHIPTTFTWRHVGALGDGAGATPCWGAFVTVTATQQTFAEWTTETTTACNSHDETGTEDFIFTRLLVGTVTWRITGTKLVLTHAGIGRITLTRAKRHR